MIKQKNKILLLLSIVFIFSNLLVFVITDLNKEQRISNELQKNIGLLEDHYNLIMDIKKDSADIAFESIVSQQKVLNILKQANHTDNKEKMARLNKELYALLKEKFKFMKKRGVKIALIALPNNKVFLRLHKPSKFADDISNVRYGVTKVNKEHKILRGFEKGKVSHALRNIYPVFDENGKFIASFDIAYDISLLEDMLLNVSDVHTNIIIHKDILASRIAGYTNSKTNYIPTKENENFKIRNGVVAFEDKSYDMLLKNKSSAFSQTIKHNMDIEKMFSLYFQGEKNIKVASFYPIKNIKDNKAVAWLVSHNESDFINTTLRSVTIIRTIIFMFSLFLIYFLYKTLKQKSILDEKVEQQTKELRASNQKLQELIEDQEAIIQENIKIANEERDKAVSSTKAKAEFLANMSHEIRTPLNAALGFIDVLKEEKLGPRIEQYINIIDKSSKNLLRIIEDILDFSKIESGKLDIENIDFHSKSEFSVITHLFNAKCSEKNISLILNIDDNLPEYINTDPLRIKQIIMNLIGNAVKFTGNGKRIIVTLSYENELLNVSVKDEGIGISKDKLTHIFEAFGQEDSSTTRKFGGTGLGLSISKELTRLLKGKLKVRSEVGVGSEFYFSIPIKIGKENLLSSNENCEDLTFENKKILLVEDNQANQMFMKVILKKQNMNFDIVNDGLEAVDIFKKEQYDAILMDENMPNMNGIEATKRIRNIEKELKLPHTPIIALTANALKGDRERFLEAGMDEHITKPLNKQRLCTVLDRLL